MLDPVEALLDSGFHRAVVLDGAECGLDAEQSLILALWCYAAEKQPASDGAWIHPYYFASQKAYTAASSLVKSGAFPGLALRDEIRVKPIFARLPDFSQGTNTISYIRGIGSRFHVQILTYTPRLPATAHLLSEINRCTAGNAESVSTPVRRTPWRAACSTGSAASAIG